MRNIIYIFIAVVFLSCNREKPDFLGGSLNDQFGELLVLDSLTSSTSDFNFSTVSPRFFEAQWSKNFWKPLLQTRMIIKYVHVMIEIILLTEDSK